MDLPCPSLGLHQTVENEDCILLRYLIAKDKPNYEFLNDDEDIHSLVSVMDAESSFHRSIHVRRLVPRERADGEARIIRQYFGANPIYTPEKFRERFCMKHHVFIRILDGFIIWKFSGTGSFCSSTSQIA